MTAPTRTPEQKNALADALTLAIKSGDLEMMGLAVDSGAEPQTLLFAAIDHRNKDWAALALAKGADANGKKRGYLGNSSSSETCPALFWLVENFNPDVGDAMVKNGADFNLKSDGGITPLHWAALRGDKAMIEWFVKSGADPLAPGTNGKTPMQYLSSNDKIDTATRTALTKLMLKQMQPADKPAEAFNQVTTKQAIDISHPIELKKRPDGGGLNL